MRATGSPENLVSQPSQQSIRDALKGDLHILDWEGRWAVFGAVSGLLLPLTEGEAESLRLFLAGVPVEEQVSQETAVALLHRILGALRARKIAHEGLPAVAALLLILTEDCNLACRYCYCRRALAGHPAACMDVSTARRAIEFATENGIHTVAFFGGEPLLNMPALRAAVSRARELGASMDFSLSTNATLVTEAFGEYCHENGIRVSVSMDGPREVHDAARVHQDGSGSYDAAMRGVDILRKWQVLQLLEATHSMQHPAAIGKSMEALAARFPRVSCTCVDGPDDCSYADHIVTGRRYALYYQELLEFAGAAQLQGRSIQVGGIDELLAQFAADQVPHRPYICSGVMQRLSVSVDGSLYPCPETQQPRHRIGSLWEAWDPAALDARRRAALAPLRRDRLHDCWYKHLADVCVVRLREDGRGRLVVRDSEAIESGLRCLLTEVAHSDLLNAHRASA